MAGPAPALAPEEILALRPAAADGLLDRLEREVPRRPALVELPSREVGSALVFGDSHGDWPSTTRIVRAFEQAGPGSVLVGLGDYVDRAPEDCPSGSVANALYLLGLAAERPDRVFLLQGNHETVRRIGAFPHDLPDELDALWGPSASRYPRLMALLERGALAATVAGTYLAHAGFPVARRPADWRAAFPPTDDDALAEIVWAECDASEIRRGGAPVWTRKDLDAFLGASHLGTFWRGHDPDLTGRPLYDQRVMTLQTTRYYAAYGGVVYAELPLDRPVATVREAVLHRL